MSRANCALRRRNALSWLELVRGSYAVGARAFKAAVELRSGGFPSSSVAKSGEAAPRKARCKQWLDDDEVHSPVRGLASTVALSPGPRRPWPDRASLPPVLARGRRCSVEGRRGL